VNSMRWSHNHSYFYGGQWKNSLYAGIPAFKYPEDFWTYHKAIQRVRPDVIIETGTCQGGSSIFFRDELAALGGGRVITIDVNWGQRQFDVETDITTVVGSSTDPDVVEGVRQMIPEGSTVLVSLDSDHTEAHVTAELALWSDLVTVGSYIVVEDTFLGFFDFTSGPEEERFREDTGKTPHHAALKFISNNKNFVQDSEYDPMVTMNPGGWLKRIS